MRLSERGELLMEDLETELVGDLRGLAETDAEFSEQVTAIAEAGGSAGGERR